MRGMLDQGLPLFELIHFVSYEVVRLTAFAFLEKPCGNACIQTSSSNAFHL